MSPDFLMVHAYTPDPDIGLFGGRWVPTGTGTVRWQQERQPEPKAKGAARPPIDGDRDCAVCGTTFTPTTNSAAYCSDDCRATVRRQQKRAYDAKRRGRWAA